MDIRQNIEETLVAPMREMATRQQHMTIAQEQAASDEALAVMAIAVKRDQLLHMAPSDVDFVLRRISRLQMLADAYRRESGNHERMVGKLHVLLKSDDLDAIRDLVEDEYVSIHGPRE